MVNSRKLRGKIVEMGFTLSTFADNIKMSRPCLRSRINGKTEFRASEIEKICSALQIKRSEFEDYFFANDVPKMDT